MEIGYILIIPNLKNIGFYLAKYQHQFEPYIAREIARPGPFPIIICSGLWRMTLYMANFKEVQNWLDDWIRFKYESFSRRSIYVLLERWQKKATHFFAEGIQFCKYRGYYINCYLTYNIQLKIRG